MARLPIVAALLTIGGLAGALVTNHRLEGQASAPPVYPKEMTSYREVVKRVLPAVVSVEAWGKATPRGKQSAQRRRPDNAPSIPGLPEEFRRFFEGQDGFPEMPEQSGPRHAFGSGFIIDPKGTIVTNNHVVAGAARVEITLTDGTKFTSNDIKRDEKNDLAIVRVKTTSPLPHLEMGNSDTMEIGDRVLALGAPFGLTGSVTSGIVSAKGRSGLSGRSVVYEDYLQTDAAINPGNSGGPLVNLEGRVIGINTAIKTESGGWQGVGMAIASNVAKGVIDQLVRDGVVHRGYLGVLVGPLDPEVASQMGLKQDSGVVVSQVVKGGPASKAGLKPGDIITTMDGKPVKDSRELQHIVGSLAVHKQIDLSVIRDEKPLALHVTIEEQPGMDRLVGRDQESREPGQQQDQEELSVDSIGINLTDLTPELASRSGYDEGTQGAMITEVLQDSVASRARLQRGMLISQINRKMVKSASAARTMLQRADLEKGVLLQVKFSQNGEVGTTYIVLRGEPANKQ